MKRFIITRKQLDEYIEKKRNDKIFYDIVEQLYNNKKMLSENVSHKKVNQSVIDNYKRKNIISPKVFEMLVSHKIINENYEIL